VESPLIAVSCRGMLVMIVLLPVTSHCKPFSTHSNIARHMTNQSIHSQLVKSRRYGSPIGQSIGGHAVEI